MQAKRTLKEVALELGLELRGKSQQELWEEIVKRVSKKPDVAKLLARKRESSPDFRWTGRRALGE